MARFGRAQRHDATNAVMNDFWHTALPASIFTHQGSSAEVRLTGQRGFTLAQEVA